MRKHMLVAITAILVLALAPMAMAADNPFVGTWKMNMGKSKSPINQGSTIVVQAQENGIKCVNDSVDANGKATHAEWAAKYDGKDYPIAGNSNADTISLTRIDTNTAHYVQKKNGKEVQSGESVVSKDGKIWTLAGKGKNAKGQETRFIAMFDKQLATAAMAADPHVGTWKLNAAKSKYPLTPAPKSQVVIIEARGNGYMYTFDGVDAAGKNFHEEFAPNVDGKDYPVIGDSDANKVSSIRIDANTINHIFKKDGKLVNDARVVISKDGKTSTVTEKRKNSKGQDFTTIEVYEKQ
jgi:hypothetical protein